MIKKCYSINKLLILKSIQFFVENPYKEVYLREYGRTLKISPNSAQRFLNLFLKQGFINEFRRGNLRFFKANLESLSFKHIKITFFVNKIEKSGLIEILKNNGVSHVVLFGSSAEGTDDSKSDVDLLIIGINKQKINDKIKEIQKAFDREISIHFFSWSEWKDQAKNNKAFYFDVITKGINLIGNIPVVEK